MRPLDIIKKRVEETREKKMRAEVELEQLNKREADYYAEATELVGEPVRSPEDIRKHRDQLKKKVGGEMKTLAHELKSINALTEEDIKTLKEEGYL